MTQFSSHHDVSLEKSIINANKFKKNDLELLKVLYDIEKCVSWIEENGFQKVCLQFPDKLLLDAVDVALEFEKRLKFKVFILGDTAYESCCIDYIAAEHVNADAVIHFGESCFSQVEQKIPVLIVNEKKTIADVVKFKEIFLKQFCEEKGTIYLVCDNPYRNLIDILRVEFGDLKISLIISIDEYKNEFSKCHTIFIGKNGRTLMNFYRKFEINTLYIYDPEDIEIRFERFSEDSKAYKRQYYLIETVKDSKTIGIVVGTLSVKNYLEIIDRIKKLCKIHAKKCYIISVGKPNTAKLANFPEIDVFCIIACPQNEIYDSRDFYKPIVTPSDIEAALNPGQHLDGSHVDRFDYNNILVQCLPNDIDSKNAGDIADVSLISGKVRVLYSNAGKNTNISDDMISSQQLAIRSDMSIVSGADYLSSRSWQGLDPNLGVNEPKLAVEGRKGLAKGYRNEQ